MKFKTVILTTVLLLPYLFSHILWAEPTSAYQAEKVVAGWLKSDPQPLNMALGPQVTNVETFTNEANEPIYHIVYLQQSGYVVVSADDLVEPIIAFVKDGSYDPSPDNPL